MWDMGEGTEVLTQNVDRTRELALGHLAAKTKHQRERPFVVLTKHLIPLSIGNGCESCNSLHELFKACTADAVCNTTYPNLEDTFYNLVAKLNDTPAKIHVVDPQTGILLKRITMPGDFPITWLGDEAIGTVIDFDGKWSNADAAKTDEAEASPPCHYLGLSHRNLFHLRPQGLDVEVE